MNMSEMRACRILNIWETGHNYSQQINYTNEGKFRKKKKKKKKKKGKTAVSTLCRVSLVQNNQTLESGITSESLKREVAEQIYSSYERQ